MHAVPRYRVSAMSFRVRTAYTLSKNSSFRDILVRETVRPRRLATLDARERPPDSWNSIQHDPGFVGPDIPDLVHVEPNTGDVKLMALDRGSALAGYHRVRHQTRLTEQSLFQTRGTQYRRFQARGTQYRRLQTRETQYRRFQTRGTQ